MKTGIVWGDRHLLETVTWLSLLPVEDCCLSFESQRKLVFCLYVTGHFLQSRQNVWSFIKRILLQNGLYKKDNKLKYTQYSEKCSNMLIEFVQLLASTKGRNNRFWGMWKSPSPKRRHWGDGIRREEIGTSLMTWNYMPGWAPHHSNLSRFLFLIIPACSEDPIIIYVIKLIRILQTLW